MITRSVISGNNYTMTGATGWIGTALRKRLDAIALPEYWYIHLAPTELPYEWFDKPNLLFASSGAVYGQGIIRFAPETYPIGNNCTEYGDLKVRTERVVSDMGGISARIFTLIGPNQPDRFAVTGFVKAAKAGKPITIYGDGQTVRSYMHLNDCVHWLYQLMLHGKHGEAYNVGSFNPVTFETLAKEIARELPPAKIQVLNIRKEPVPVYYPDTAKAEGLGLRMSWSLWDSVKEMCNEPQ